MHFMLLLVVIKQIATMEQTMTRKHTKNVKLAAYGDCI